MKKIININLSGRVIPIEDAAYESLQRYIDSLRRYFAQEEGRDEIINDIESRIAELMDDKVRKGATAITEADVNEIVASMGRVEDFELADEASTTTEAPGYTAIPASSGKKRGRLYRDSSDKILGGVASGLANYLDVDPSVVRILMVIFGFTGWGILLYIILWIVLPQKDLNDYVGKRLFRNPDDKVISGVAGGLAAYFNKPSWAIRLIIAAPLILNIIFGTLHGIFFPWHHDMFPNIFFIPFSGTFVLAYVILWMVLPEAKSSFEKMEMRGEKVDVNRIRQNVKDEMESFKTRAQAWGEEVKTSAQELGDRAKTFANTKGRAFAGEVGETARPVARGIGHIIGVIFKAFFIFVAGCIALTLFAVLIAIIFGGVAWWPVNNFLWSSAGQKLLAWGTLIFFLAVPLIAFITWLIRRIIRVRSKSHLGWIFGGLWLIGWLCAISFGISIANDLRVYDRTTALPVAIAQPPNGKMIVQVTEPEIHYSGQAWWFDGNEAGWDLTDDTMRYNNVKIRVLKSEDSAYHVNLYKYSAGSSGANARERASRTMFTAYSQDSLLNLGSGLAIGRESKFRGQGVLVEIQVPQGKKIRFDQTIVQAYNPWVVRTADRNYRNKFWAGRHRSDWDLDDSFDWDVDIDYTMGANGELINPLKPVENVKDSMNQGIAIPADSLRQIRKEQIRVKDSIEQELKRTEREINQKQSYLPDVKHPGVNASPDLPFISILI